MTIFAMSGRIKAINSNQHNELMNVSLTPELEQLVHQKVKSGRYKTCEHFPLVPFSGTPYFNPSFLRNSRSYIAFSQFLADLTCLGVRFLA
ncbi:MAG: ribbon-helix-helix domain-containing protein [Hassallia sp.]